MSNTCGCQNSGNADFAELAPVLKKNMQRCREA